VGHLIAEALEQRRFGTESFPSAIDLGGATQPCPDDLVGIFRTRTLSQA
jgi:hypothetical protein